ncbi:MAG: hypothetical protein N3F07_01715 [Candidatus Micrarchaeota archaeon]|nr:hypothetical protein [Candidatus Micrarchaeota archaeon]
MLDLGNMRGQAAMEYLMTYGWALLVIVIVIAILLIINPFSAPQGCRFDQLGFTCSNPLIDTNGKLFLKITNGNNNAVNIYKIICTQDKSAVPQIGTPWASPVFLARNAEMDTGSLSASNAIICQKASGGAFTSEAGLEFIGKVWVFYKNEEDGANYPYRTASANVVTKTVKATATGGSGGGTGGGTGTGSGSRSES